MLIFGAVLARKQEATAHYEMEKLQIRGFFGCRGKAE